MFLFPLPDGKTYLTRHPAMTTYVIVNPSAQHVQQAGKPLEMEVQVPRTAKHHVKQKVLRDQRKS